MKYIIIIIIIMWPDVSWKRRHCRPGQMAERPGDLEGGDGRDVPRRLHQNRQPGGNKEQQEADSWYGTG